MKTRRGKNSDGREQAKASNAYAIWRNRLAIRAKMGRDIFLVALALHVVALAGAAWAVWPEIYWTAKYAYAKAALGKNVLMTIWASDTSAAAGYLTISARAVAAYLTPTIAEKFATVMRAFCWTLLAWPAGLAGGLVYFGRMGKKEFEPLHLRGTQVASDDETRAAMRASGAAGDLPLGGIWQPYELENRHLLVCGIQGAGKTMLSRARFKKLLQRGAQVVCYSYKHDDLFCVFFDPARDAVFAPFDARTAGWNIFNEVHPTDPIVARMDISAIAKSLIPPRKEAEKNAWVYENAADVFEAILWRLWVKGKRTNRAVWNLCKLASTDVKGLAEKLRLVPGCEAAAGHLTNEGEGRTVLSTFVGHCRCFEFLADLDGNFSLREWMQNDRRGVLWVLNEEKSKEIMRPLLTLFYDLAIRFLMDMPDDRNRRRHFLIDELTTLGYLGSLNTVLTMARSKGAAVEIAFQSAPLLWQQWGRGLAEHIWGQCSSRMYLRVQDLGTADYMSRSIGDAEMLDRTTSQNWGADSNRQGGEGAQESRRNRRAVMPEEIMQLPDLAGYAYVLGQKWTRTTIPVEQYQPKHPAFIARAIDLAGAATTRTPAANAAVNDEAESLDFE